MAKRQQDLVQEQMQDALDKGAAIAAQKAVPKDPWGNEYLYLYPGVNNKDSFDLSSYGSDGVESEDDIVNWEKESKPKSRFRGTPPGRLEVRLKFMSR